MLCHCALHQETGYIKMRSDQLACLCSSPGIKIIQSSENQNERQDFTTHGKEKLAAQQ